MWMPLFRIADAEENLGESEVREAHLAKSLFFIRIMDKVYNNYNLLISCMILESNFDSALSYVQGESLGTSQGNRNQDSCCWPENGLGVLYIAAWFLWHGFWSHFQKHRQSQKVMLWITNICSYALCHIFLLSIGFLTVYITVAACLRKVVIGKGRIGWKCMKACTACPLEISRRLPSYFWILFQPSPPMNFFPMTPLYFILFWPALYHWIEFP